MKLDLFFIGKIDDEKYWKVIDFFNVYYIKILMRNIDVVWVYKGR